MQQFVENYRPVHSACPGSFDCTPFPSLSHVIKIIGEILIPEWFLSCWGEMIYIFPCKVKAKLYNYLNWDANLVWFQKLFFFKQGCNNNYYYNNYYCKLNFISTLQHNKNMTSLNLCFEEKFHHMNWSNFPFLLCQHFFEREVFSCI